MSLAAPHSAPSAPKLTGAGRIALIIVGLGCLLGLERSLIAGSGASISSPAASSELATICAVARLLAIIAVGIIAYRQPHLPWRALASICAVVLAFAGIACTLAFTSPDTITVIGLLLGALIGAAEGILLLGWALTLVRLDTQYIVIGALCATVIGGSIIAALSNIDGVARAIVIGIAAIICGVCLFVVAPTASEDEEQKTDHSLPHFSAAMFITCGFIGMVLYGLAATLFGITASSLNFAVFGIATGVGLLITVAIALLAPSPRRLVWIGQFALLLVCLVVSLTTSWSSLSITLGLLSAFVFCQHCLRWAVVPLICGPRTKTFTVAALVALTDSTIPYVLGGAFGSLVAPSPQSLGSAAGVMALVLVVILVCALLLERGAFSTSTTGAAQTNIASPLQTAESTPVDIASDPEQQAAQAVPEQITPEQRLETIAQEHGFTARELEIAQLTAKGNSSLRIADILVISSSTVRFHQQNIYRKLDIHSRQEFIDLVNGTTTENEDA